ncbi:SRPBCC family protein [Kitasatospora purpeofusca]|uniref:SRPBCC family protein n=1 Tax=Kitasatospora purpeofusca TaxID=67352 RepID=UPI00224D91F8|nr:SRPBCC domain-containing protein [Kitasatospora purpeofusca]MCX4754397.1 SRPBCC domain-containing protein [Kitasatospora purpeofusca]WSR33822.1 SRPBCC domain-containing protein [Kitasatospora purpeofusca]WSR42038.1 SRPBCC domain-containing protein [Kitasatospora purpeofusca]
MTENLGTLSIVRELPATPAEVFRAYVEPEQFVRFWGPVGTTVPLDTVTIEPQVGGRFDSTMVMEATGDRYPVRGRFTAVREGELLEFLEEGVGLTGRITLTDLGDGRTEVRMEQENVPAMYLGPEAEAGHNSSFDRLVEHLAARR